MIKRTIMAIVVIAPVFLQPNATYADDLHSSKADLKIKEYCPFISQMSKDVMTLRQYGFSKEKVSDFVQKAGRGNQSKVELVNVLIGDAYTEPVAESDDGRKAAVSKFIRAENNRCIKTVYDEEKAKQ